HAGLLRAVRRPATSHGPGWEALARVARAGPTRRPTNGEFHSRNTLEKSRASCASPGRWGDRPWGDTEAHLAGAAAGRGPVARDRRPPARPVGRRRDRVPGAPGGVGRRRPGALGRHG